MKDKTIRALLFGPTANINIKFPIGRSLIFNFPAGDDDDIERNIKLLKDDGLILYLIKRIEKLENNHE